MRYNGRPLFDWSVVSLMKAYLDIETSFSNNITVIGIYVAGSNRLTHIVGDCITPETVLDSLRGVESIYTYNGNRFDLPVIHQNLGINLRKLFISCDLMYDCWKNNLKGGLKAVERSLGISRDIDGKGEDDPRILWRRYRMHRDLNSLERLLTYNKEDTVNLLLLENRLKNRRNGGGMEQVTVDSYSRLI
jgi:uncharacterized protein YprB with RNaseH-like and TPR domain